MAVPFLNTTPSIVYYGFMIECTEPERKTPKYRQVHAALNYAPLNEMIGKDGFVSVFLKELPSSNPNAPKFNLQGKGSINITGLYFLPSNGKKTFAFGYPNSSKTYSKDKKPNPFYPRRNDGYVFILHYKQGEKKPWAIEWFVLEGFNVYNLKSSIKMYCGQFKNGQWDKRIVDLRRQANIKPEYLKYLE